MNECMLWGEENAAAIRRITFVRTYIENLQIVVLFFL